MTKNFTIGMENTPIQQTSPTDFWLLPQLKSHLDKDTSMRIKKNFRKMTTVLMVTLTNELYHVSAEAASLD
jgi:hypothetical protein